MLEGSSESTDLRIGMTSADFQTCANLFEENEVLTRFVIAESVIGKLSFSTLAVTLSRPVILRHAVFENNGNVLPSSSFV